MLQKSGFFGNFQLACTVWGADFDGRIYWVIFISLKAENWFLLFVDFLILSSRVVFLHPKLWHKISRGHCKENKKVPYKWSYLLCRRDTFDKWRDFGIGNGPPLCHRSVDALLSPLSWAAAKPITGFTAFDCENAHKAVFSKLLQCVSVSNVLCFYCSHSIFWSWILCFSVMIDNARYSV